MKVEGPEFAGYVKETGRISFTADQTEEALEDQLKEMELKLEQTHAQMQQAVTEKQLAQQAAREVVKQSGTAVQDLEKARINEQAAMELLLGELRTTPEESQQVADSMDAIPEPPVPADRDTIMRNAGVFIADKDSLKLYEKSNKVQDPVQTAFFHLLKTQSKLFEV